MFLAEFLPAILGTVYYVTRNATIPETWQTGSSYVLIERRLISLVKCSTSMVIIRWHLGYEQVTLN